jgi:hypothetical protein
MQPLEVHFTHRGRRCTWLRFYDPTTTSPTAAANRQANLVLDTYPDARGVQVFPHTEHRLNDAGVCILCGHIN